MLVADPARVSINIARTIVVTLGIISLLVLAILLLRGNSIELPGAAIVYSTVFVLAVVWLSMAQRVARSR